MAEMTNVLAAVGNKLFGSIYVENLLRAHQRVTGKQEVLGHCPLV